METSIASVPKLPDDLIIEILARLPAKSLLQFRCVCKSWLSIISSQQLAKTHLNNSKKDPNFTAHRLLLRNRGNLKQCSVNSLLYEPLTSAFDIDYLFNPSRNSIVVVGSCDGLVCLVVDRKDLILCNPCTRIWKILPDCGVKMDFGGYFTYGFGFDKSSDDYKVVGFFNGNKDLSEVIVEVYSLKSDSWRRIQNLKGRWLMDDPAIFANGKLHLIAYTDLGSESMWDIVSVDLETEDYEMLKMPSYVKPGHYSRLGASEGRLYVLCSHSNSADVWIMDDGCESWAKVVVVPYVDDFLKYTYKKPLYVLKDGRVVLLCSSALVVFDAKDCSFRYPEVENSGEFVAGRMCGNAWEKHTACRVRYILLRQGYHNKTIACHVSQPRGNTGKLRILRLLRLCILTVCYKCYGSTKLTSNGSYILLSEGGRQWRSGNCPRWCSNCSCSCIRRKLAPVGVPGSAVSFCTKKRPYLESFAPAVMAR